MTRFELIDNAYKVFKDTLTEKQLQHLDDSCAFATFASFIESYLNGYTFYLEEYEEYTGQLSDLEVIKDYAYALLQWMQINCGFIGSSKQCQKVIEYIKENKENLCQN